MRHLIFALFSTTILALSVNGFASGDAEAQRQALQDARETALEMLYGENPAARQEIAGATGYAVFTGHDGGESSSSSRFDGGILHNNRDGKDLYMKMLPTGGDGMNGENFNLAIIFHTAEAFDNFKDVGWDFSGQLNSNVDSPLTGVGASGAASVMPGTTVYQFTETGMVDQPSLQGIKFMMDEKLN